MYDELKTLYSTTSMGYVYILHNPESNLVKIGKTKNPKSRFSALTNQSGTKLKYYITKPMYIETLIERIMHNKFAMKRKKGEWFSIPFEEAVKELNNLVTSDDFIRRNTNKNLVKR